MNRDRIRRVNYWEIIADNLSKAGWELGLRKLGEISCVRLSSDTNSQRNEHVRAFNKSRACIRRALRFGRISVGSGAECIAAVAPACPPGRKSCRAQLRGDDDRLRQLRSCC